MKNILIDESDSSDEHITEPRLEDAFTSSDDENPLADNKNKITSNTTEGPVMMNATSNINHVINNIMNELPHQNNSNGWDQEAGETINNWYLTFKQHSFVYQLVLDRNITISDYLIYFSIFSSFILGLFSGFKILIGNDIIYQTLSNILFMFFNFGNAILMALSKNYTDVVKNEHLRNYINRVDDAIGELSSQIMISPEYRDNADHFIKINIEKYDKIFREAPNISLYESNKAIEIYKLIK